MKESVGPQKTPAHLIKKMLQVAQNKHPGFTLAKQPGPRLTPEAVAFGSPEAQAMKSSVRGISQP